MTSGGGHNIEMQFRGAVPHDAIRGLHHHDANARSLFSNSLITNNVGSYLGDRFVKVRAEHIESELRECLAHQLPVGDGAAKVLQARVQVHVAAEHEQQRTRRVRLAERWPRNEERRRECC